MARGVGTYCLFWNLDSVSGSINRWSLIIVAGAFNTELIISRILEEPVTITVQGYFVAMYPCTTH